MNEILDDGVHVARSPLYSKKTQKLLNKLISEEMLADLTYRSALCKCKLIDAAKLVKMFQTIADDELGDHYKALVTFAMMNDFTVPSQEKEYKKYASPECWKIYDSLKNQQDAKYYIEQAIKSEQDAIKSYEEAMNDDEVPYELYTILQKNYYDEVEHLEDLHTLAIADDASADLAWTNMYDGESPDISYFWPYSYAYGACTIN